MTQGHTHIEVAAYHEAGHALAALKVGRYVGNVSIDQSLPGNGLTRHWRFPRNPFHIMQNPEFAWQHTFQTTLDEMFIALAGPLAEARLLRKPLRHLGSYADYNECLRLVHRLKNLAVFASEYVEVPRFDLEVLLDRTRNRTKRWVAHPRTWGYIDRTAKALIVAGQLDGEQLTWAIGSAHTPDQLTLPQRKPARMALRSCRQKRGRTMYRL